MKTKLELHAELDILNKNELDTSLTSQFDRYERAKAAGETYVRFKMTGLVAAAAVTIPAAGARYGPADGYCWSLRRITIGGLTGGAAPDFLNMFFGDGTEDVPEWQFNGQNFAYTFGKGQLTMLGGETLVFANAGALTATGIISVRGEGSQVPAEMIYKVINLWARYCTRAAAA
jgi:hypothetical protein